MKVLVSVCGIGLGHATRVLSILNKLGKGNEVRIFASGMASRYLREAGYTVSDIESVEFESDRFTFSTFSTLLDNMDLPMNFTKNYFKISEVIDTFKPDLVFCDSEPTSFVISKLKKVRLVVLTNLISSFAEARNLPKQFRNRNTSSQLSILNRLINTVVKHSDLVVNPSFISGRSLSKKVRFTGLIVRERVDELPAERTLREKFGDDFYLVSFGGSPFGSTLFREMSEVLSEFSDRKFIVSSGFRVKSRTRMRNMTVFPFIDRYLEYLKACRGVISTAGYSTISETIAYRKPSVLVPIHNHVEQMANASLLDRLGLSKACFLESPGDTWSLRKGIERFFAQEDKIRRKVEMFEVKTDGAAEIAEMLTAVARTPRQP